MWKLPGKMTVRKTLRYFDFPGDKSTFLNLSYDDPAAQKPWLLHEIVPYASKIPQVMCNGKRLLIHRVLFSYFRKFPIKNFQITTNGSINNINPWTWELHRVNSHPYTDDHIDEPQIVFEEDLADLVEYIKDAQTLEGLDEFYTALEIERACKIANFKQN